MYTRIVPFVKDFLYNQGMKTISASRPDHPLRQDLFPRSSRYDPEWVFENNMGPNVLWLTEWLAEEMRLEPGMRVLDMGCGRAISSVFLRAEYGVEVWANDLWISATENWERIRDTGFEDMVHPIHAEAHALPYAEGFFDAALSLDSWQYYGTDELYLGYFHKFVKAGGRIGIVVPGLKKDFPGGSVPAHLSRRQRSGGVFWAWDCVSFHTAEWWSRFLSRYPFTRLETCDAMKDGGRLWESWERALDAWGGKKMFPSDLESVSADNDEYLTFIRAVVRRVEE